MSTISDQYTSRTQAVVMRRVRTIYLMQMFLMPVILSIVVGIAALWGIGREVWVARVIQNMPSLTNISAVMRFYETAFLDTRLAVQALILLVLVAALWFIVNIVKLLRQTSLYA